MSTEVIGWSHYSKRIMMNKQYSESEAQRIFALAAERQQQSESPQKNRLTLEDLEEAGLAAGIAPEFIKSAAADLLRPGSSPSLSNLFGYACIDTAK